MDIGLLIGVGVGAIIFTLLAVKFFTSEKVVQCMRGLKGERPEHISMNTI
jgi:hypothetical protein